MRRDRLGIFFSLVFLVSVWFLGCERKEEKEIGGTSEKEFQDKSADVITEIKISPEILLIDDFNDMDKSNNIGGNFGSWNKDPNDYTQYCRDSFEKKIRINKTGYSLRLDYDVDSPNPAYNGFWSKLNNIDLSPFHQLVFYVKGDKINGYTQKFKVELKNSKGQVGKYLVTGLTDYWQRIVIPFNKFTDITDWRKMIEFVIVFDDITATRKVGTLYIDDICFQ